MRLWSLHPSYLDLAGLLACWRESLLAQSVLLRGSTQGWANHSQLARFRYAQGNSQLGSYLWALVVEATARGYEFEHTKIKLPVTNVQQQVTTGQLEYEWRWLMSKLAKRAPALVRPQPEVIRPHPLFTAVPGPIADWERVKELA